MSSRTLSPLSDSRRLRAVGATRALSATISCVQPRSERAARTWRKVIMHGSPPPLVGETHSYDHNSRLVALDQRLLSFVVAPNGRLRGADSLPVRSTMSSGSGIR